VKRKKKGERLTENLILCKEGGKKHGKKKNEVFTMRKGIVYFLFVGGGGGDCVRRVVKRKMLGKHGGGSWYPKIGGVGRFRQF